MFSLISAYMSVIIGERYLVKCKTKNAFEQTDKSLYIIHYICEQEGLLPDCSEREGWPVFSVFLKKSILMRRRSVDCMSVCLCVYIARIIFFYFFMYVSVLLPPSQVFRDSVLECWENQREKAFAYVWGDIMFHFQHFMQISVLITYQ